MADAALTVPVPSVLPQYSNPPVRSPPPDASAPEGTKLREVLEHFAHPAFKLPVKEGSSEARGWDDWEKTYLSQELFKRFLIATRWNVSAAIKRIEACMLWRRTVNIYDVRGMAELVAPEFECGKVLIAGYDRACQPIFYTWQSRNVLPASPRQVTHMMFCMERAMDLIPAGVEKILFAADLSGKSSSSPSALSVSRQIINNLQSHYPERLGAACAYNMSWLGSVFLNLILPFIDADTRKKVHINPDFTKDLIAPDQLLDMYPGGKLKFEYTEAYVPALVDLCMRKREANMERWKAAGGTVGLSEWDILERVEG